MTSTNLERLLIEHLADLDDGVKRLQRLQNFIGSKMQLAVDNWAKTNGWAQADDWNSDEETSVGLPYWFDDTTWKAWFCFASDNAHDRANSSGETDEFWLTSLCGAGRGKIGFRFGQDELGWGKWKAFVKQQPDRLAGTRFVFDDLPGFFLPVRIDQATLAQAVEDDDFDAAFAPLKEALDHIKEHVAKFEELLSEAAAQAGN